jgi:malonate transporter
MSINETTGTGVVVSPIHFPAYMASHAGLSWSKAEDLIVMALLPVFLVLALGYFAGRRKLIDNRNIATLNVLLMQFSLPITLFVSIAKTPRALIVENGMLALVLALSLLIVYVVVYRIHRRVYKQPIGDSAVTTLTTAFPNFASIGLPLLLPVFGAQAALPVAIAIAVGSVTISPVTLALLELHKVRERGSAAEALAARAFLVALRRAVSKPIFIGPMLGLAVALSGLQLPAIVGVALGPLISATAGIGLFLTGLMVSAQTIRVETTVTLGAVTKNLLQPLLVYGLVRLFSISPTVGAQAVLLSAIPCGFFGLVFGASSGVRPTVAGSTLVISSVTSIVTLSIAIVLLVHQ